MKKLWVHAGFPKNGSSAIQVFLAKNRIKLLEEGIDYLDISDLSAAKEGKITSGNGAKLSRTLLSSSHEAYLENGEEIYSSFLESLRMSKSTNAVVSSEYFPFAKGESVEKLISDVEEFGFEVKLLFYVRRQDQFLLSGYMQRVKRHGYIGTPDEFVLSRVGKSPALDYHSICNKFSNFYGRENIYPFAFDVVKKHRNGLVGHFLEVISGVDFDWIESQDPINTSPSLLELKLLLLCNRYKPRMQFSDILIENSIITGRSKPFATHQLLSPDAVNKIMNHYDVENRRFFEEYCCEGEFSPTDTSKWIDLKEGNFSTDEVLDVISGLIVDFDKRLSALEKIK